MRSQKSHLDYGIDLLQNYDTKRLMATLGAYCLLPPQDGEREEKCSQGWKNLG